MLTREEGIESVDWSRLSGSLNVRYSNDQVKIRQPSRMAWSLINGDDGIRHPIRWRYIMRSALLRRLGVMNARGK